MALLCGFLLSTSFCSVCEEEQSVRKEAERKTEAQKASRKKNDNGTTTTHHAQKEACVQTEKSDERMHRTECESRYEGREKYGDRTADDAGMNTTHFAQL